MDTTALLTDPSAIRLADVRPSTGSITLVVRTVRPHTTCPRCQIVSLLIHSSYIRHVADLPGQVNRLKLIKRQMYGRAKFDLLRARVLYPT